jgi:hypothetical protein
MINSLLNSKNLCSLLLVGLFCIFTLCNIEVKADEIKSLKNNPIPGTYFIYYDHDISSYGFGKVEKIKKYRIYFKQSIDSYERKIAAISNANKAKKDPTLLASENIELTKKQLKELDMEIIGDNKNLQIGSYFVFKSYAYRFAKIIEVKNDLVYLKISKYIFSSATQLAYALKNSIEQQDQDESYELMHVIDEMPKEEFQDMDIREVVR